MEATLRSRDKRFTNPAQFPVIDFPHPFKYYGVRPIRFIFVEIFVVFEVLRPIKDLQNKGSP